MVNKVLCEMPLFSCSKKL